MSGLILLGGWLSLFWLAVFWWMTLDNPRRWDTVLYAALASFLAVILDIPALWLAAMNGYPNDSFWTLGTGGRWIIGGVSVLGIAAVFGLLDLKTRVLLNGRHSTAVLLITDCAIGIAVFVLLFALSPQIFYEIYRLFDPALPAQIIVDIPREVIRLFEAAKLPEQSAMANHLAGIAILAIIPFTTWQHAQTFAGSGPRVWLLVTAWVSLQFANAL